MAGTKGNQNAKKDGSIKLKARIIVLVTEDEDKRVKAKAEQAEKELGPYVRALINDDLGDD